jgi:hypothetical protein
LLNVLLQIANKLDLSNQKKYVIRINWNGISGIKEITSLHGRKVADSIQDDITEFCNLPNPSNRIMPLGFTQLQTEMRTGNFPEG